MTESAVAKEAPANELSSAADVIISGAEMKAFVANHFTKFVNDKDLTQAHLSFSEEYVDHAAEGGDAVGPAAAIRAMQTNFEKWPDLRVVIEDMVAEGDKITVRCTWYGTSLELGAKISFQGFCLLRFAGGKIIERWATLSPVAVVE